MKKTVIIFAVVLCIALGAMIIANRTSILQNAFGDSSSSDANGNTNPPSSGTSGSGGNDDANDGGKPAGSQTDDNQPAATQASAQSELQRFLHDNAASRTTIKKGGIAFVTNSTSTLVLVNKKRELDPGYVPSDLVKAPVPFSFSGDSPKQEMRKVAADALGKLFAGAEQDGIELKAVSGYRSYASQKSIFNAYAKTHGEEEANTFSAHPGQSEHQTGLAMDVSSASVHYGLEESYGETKEGKWLKAHAADYGFIIRFEQGKEKETGYMYEPWHVRYVGVYVAKDIMKLGLTLEAYLARY